MRRPNGYMAFYSANEFSSYFPGDHAWQSSVQSLACRFLMLVWPKGDIMLQPTAGFQVCSVHSMEV